VHSDADNGKKGAYKQLPEYRALLSRLIEATDDPEIRGSFAWIVDQMFEAIEGEAITKECPECGTNVYMYKKPDITAAKYLIDQVADKPTNRTEVDIDIKSRHEELNVTFDPGELKVHRIDPMEARRRREALENAEVQAVEGVIVGEDE
jgi:predicted  nucleic acid-binding Zn-ribbon protein